MRLNLFYARLNSSQGGKRIFSLEHVLCGVPLYVAGLFTYCLTFAFVADHCENILRHFLRIFADRANKMAESRKK